MMDTAIRSPIHSAQERIGGTFDDWDGWLWTTGFGDRDGEYRAIREDVGAWDVSALIKWDVRGPDALAAADRLLTNDVLGLADGQVRYGAMVDADGRFVDDGTVYRFAADHAWVMTNLPDMEAHFALVSGGLDATSNVSSTTCHSSRSRARARERCSPNWRRTRGSSASAISGS